MKYKILFLLLFVLGSLTFSIYPQGSDTCTSGQYIVIDTANKRYKCQSGTLIYRATGINLNSATTDVATITGMPAKYIVRRFTGDNPSTSLTLATVDLRTTTGGGGTAVVSAGVLSGLTAASKFVDITLAITGDTLTASSLVIRNVTPQATAATADFTIEVTPLP